MTTMQRVDAMLGRFDRKSPRASYAQICEEMGINRQRHVSLLLSDAPRDWDKHRVIDCSKCVLGAKGCLAVLPLVLCSRSLRRVSFSGCHVTDEFVSELAEILQDHQSIRSIDVSNNPLVTVCSASPIIRMLRANKNVVRFCVEDTHIGTNVMNIIDDLCDKNQNEVANYYADDYFRMKYLFNYLDGDASGWVSMRSLVLNAPFPVLQEQLIERIAAKRPKKRSNGTISVNTFLELVYFNYKTDVEIARRMAETDVEYRNIILNWKHLLDAMDSPEGEPEGKKQNDDEEDEEEFAELEDPEEENEKVPLPGKLPIVPPADFHRLRIRSVELTPAEARGIIALAVKLQIDADARNEEEESTTEPRKEIKLTYQCLRRAYRTISQPQPLPRRFRFLKEHGEDYVPPMMRAGSRLISISKLSFLDSHSSNASFDANETMEESVLDGDENRTRWWALPPAMVRLISKFFNDRAAELPKRRQTTLAISPRTQRDLAMEKTTIPVPLFLSAEFTTDLETLKPRLLTDRFLQYGIPIEESTITLQEMVNCLNEYYLEASVDKRLSVKAIRMMTMPDADGAADSNKGSLDTGSVPKITLDKSQISKASTDTAAFAP
ncbi:hypothetical protein, conserved [Trypanosoma brucei gambiense DAL972]|uniref:Paraflagellar rod component n=3 Tax=Trypanosoma brucei TaxID=5691 RepID=Q57TU7_TRYB2|nr:hypothetical protein, conserved [Trypanosoma brucei gambiense DAL972]XP_847496.1 hypothetical protein, conserved [Trypanosoma brucei brucei TREU927]AAX80027.1 hypothetical protein, conserved [Trypanosoma brucei]RHW72974.1 paraflagellar rod component [Trypanosoma brucei equiperdum]AAZ13430.1 hypothetical protein, conserved [Trypanosoma brucei brucei TREU927]CBH13740.1 hypothetical protein, conserved [Trypanosoma brucei gambiense DAL972]|eukprot:XP_011776016.1 hypothetical protein, conserved [Trypanosoma brucei gambiense DAL972]